MLAVPLNQLKKTCIVALMNVALHWIHFYHKQIDNESHHTFFFF